MLLPEATGDGGHLVRLRLAMLHQRLLLLEPLTVLHALLHLVAVRVAYKIIPRSGAHLELKSAE